MDRITSSNEYATQLLELPPSVITEIIVGTIETAVPDLIESLRGSLQTLDDIPKKEIEDGADAARQKFVNKMGSISPRLENFFLEYVFRIPDHVLLPEDAAQRQKCSAKDEKKLQKSIDALIVDYQNALYMKEILTGKIQDGKKCLAKFKSAHNEMEATYKVFIENRLTDFKENSEFIHKKCEHHANQLEKLNCLAPPPDCDNSNASQALEKTLSKYLQ